MAACQNCGGRDTTRNEARSETVCTNCGAVLSSGEMVDQLTFYGGGRMTGQFVDSLSGNTRGFAAMYDRRESREATLARGWNNLERVAYKLRLSPGLIDASKRLYHLALQRNFTSGRNNFYVVSACLYAVCRRDQHTQMLIDFSDALMTPVKTLARVFMKLTRSLSLQVPTVDPSLFMERFANEMNLGAQANEVAQTGVRLVQAMTRDWIVTGRRPLGLCAASLLIAARYHRIRINPDDINELFRVSSSTVKKRMYEFRDTATAGLPVKDFESTDLQALPILNGPPCARPSKRRKGARALEDDQDIQSPLALMDAESELERRLVERDVEETLKGKPSMAGQVPLNTDPEMLCTEHVATDEVSDVSSEMASALDKAGRELGEQEQSHEVNEVIRVVGQEAVTLMKDVMDRVSAIPKTAAHLRPRFSTRGDTRTPLATTRSLLSKIVAGQALTEEDYAEAEQRASNSPANSVKKQTVGTPDNAAKRETDDGFLEETGLGETETGLSADADFLETGLEDRRTALLPKSKPLLSDDESDIDDIDEEDESIAADLLLSAEEKDAKALIWDELTKDVMSLVQERWRERKLRQANAALKQGTPRQKRAPLPAMENALDATKAALKRHTAYNSRINEDALAQLFS